jgi:hypothetical protein
MKFLDQVKNVLRVKGYAYRTEENYVAWIRRFILFHSKRHPKEMGNAEVDTFFQYHRDYRLLVLFKEPYVGFDRSFFGFHITPIP